MIVVSNTSPITNLAAIGQLDLLRQLYQRIVVPQAVYNELTAASGGHPGAVVAILNWVEAQTVNNRTLVTALRLELDEGEAETIALAQEALADLVLIDERIGRIVAARFGLRVVGLIGVLVEAKHRSLIPVVKPHLDALMRVGFWISQDLYSRVLRAIGE